ncbi:aminoglycoside phosphotransferase family protein [Sporosalibacterium faouarense]|uniref:aminoglycoside phosphotransferase family protein n=1 Tax=Sporosalibacterium faouarense TaxID=516123 RepID=UPI00192ACD0D|nr:aminoglycoside phosphotransferase family protein [Sporosalibacterium faouarense]
MLITEEFKTKSIRRFDENGEEWILQLPKIIDICKGKWQLYDFKIVEDLSINLIYFAKSKKYGDVVLKLEGPHPEKYTEMKALSLFNEECVCKCYALDMDIGALLLERIVPGKCLTSLKNHREQITIAAELIAKVPLFTDAKDGFPTYSQWINRAFKKARTENKVGSKMIHFIDEAEKFFKEVESNDSQVALLHGDLHHWNILQDENGNWKAIDPHGVLGPPYFESARFMTNHLDISEEENKKEILDDMINIFSTKFNETKKTITIALFVLYALSICWTFEEAAPDELLLKKDIENCEFVYNYLIKL